MSDSHNMSLLTLEEMLEMKVNMLIEEVRKLKEEVSILKNNVMLKKLC